MTTEHPITPPLNLRRLWTEQARRMHPPDPVTWLEHVANQAARWGADQELEACCEYMQHEDFHGFAKELRQARRPKPPSLAEQGLNELDLVPTHDQEGRSIDADTSVIRRALERLQELEKGNE